MSWVRLVDENTYLMNVADKEMFIIHILLRSFEP